MLLTDAARMRPAPKPINAARTYCSTMMGRVGIPVTARHRGCRRWRKYRRRSAFVAAGMPPRCMQSRTSRPASVYPGDFPDRGVRNVESRAPLHHVELEKRGLAETGEKQSGRQCREQRRHLGIGDQPSFTRPNTTVSTKAAASEVDNEWPSCTIESTSPGGTASGRDQRIYRMPRPITTIAIARPRMPARHACSRVNIFAVLRKPGSVRRMRQKVP